MPIKNEIMERTTTTRTEEEIRQILEEKREARRQKHIARIARNQANPLSASSIEALTGFLRSKKPPVTTDTKNLKDEMQGGTNSKEQDPVTKTEKKAQLKRTLSFGPTVTSSRRANLANGGGSGAPIKRTTSFKSIPPSGKASSISVKSFPTTQLQKQKLTVPYSPNFANRTQKPPIKPSSFTVKTSSTSVQKPLIKQLPKQTVGNTASAKPKTKATGEVLSNVKERKSSAWMVPLTPERKDTPPKNKIISSSPRTPNIKPFVRKSFSETKASLQRSTHLARSVSNTTLKRSQSVLARKSIAVQGILGKESRSSLWSVPKEPTEKEKIQQWLERRGRSTASCRHLGCLGHQLKDFPVQEKKSSSVRKSIKITNPNTPKTYNAIDNCASPQLKRTSILNTTFEKEDTEEEQRELKPLLSSSFTKQVEDGASDVQNAAECLKVKEEETDDKFHTPQESKRESLLDFADLQEGNFDQLLETIAALLQEPVYPEAKIEGWLKQSEKAFPAVKANALYWDIKARLEERRGNTLEALDIYNEAVENKAEPLDTMKQYFDNFLLRIGSNMPTGQRTPLLKSLGVETPMIRQSRRVTIRRPLLDTAQAFNSTAVKYELKLKQVFDTVDRKLTENSDATPIKKFPKTPMKFTAASNVVSVASEGPFHLVATPVRRSMRPKPSMMRVDENVLYVDDLDQLSPTTKAKAIVRKNNALSSD